MAQKIVYLFLVCIAVLTLDQATKIWAQRQLASPFVIAEEVLVDGRPHSINKEVFYATRAVEVLPQFMNFIYKENPAAAFSISSSIPLVIRKPMLIAISLIASLFFLVWFLRMSNDDLALLGACSIILAGAIGNLIDRIRLGYVIDFIDVHGAFAGASHWHWPTFNIADCFIVVGALLVIIRTCSAAQAD